MDRLKCNRRLICFLVFSFLISGLVSLDEAYAQGRGKSKAHKHAQKEKARIKRNKIKKEFEEDEQGNRRSSKSYDPQGNKIEEVSYNPNGSVHRKTQFTYDLDDVTEVTVFDSANKEMGRNTFQYDERRRLNKSTTRREDGSVAITLDFSYNAADDMTELFTEDSEGRKHKAEYTYSGPGRLAEARGFGPNDSLISITTYTTNDSGDVTEQTTRYPDGSLIQRVTFEYDSHGNTTRMVTYDQSDSVMSETENEYDRMDNLTITRGRVPAADINHTIETLYDNEGNPTAQRTYNKNGELVETTKYGYEKYD